MKIASNSHARDRHRLAGTRIAFVQAVPRQLGDRHALLQAASSICGRASCRLGDRRQHLVAQVVAQILGGRRAEHERVVQRPGRPTVQLLGDRLDLEQLGHAAASLRSSSLIGLFWELARPCSSLADPRHTHRGTRPKSRSACGDLDLLLQPAELEQALDQIVEAVQLLHRDPGVRDAVVLEPRRYMHFEALSALPFEPLLKALLLVDRALAALAEIVVLQQSMWICRSNRIDRLHRRAPGELLHPRDDLVDAIGRGLGLGKQRMVQELRLLLAVRFVDVASEDRFSAARAALLVGAGIALQSCPAKRRRGHAQQHTCAWPTPEQTGKASARRGRACAWRAAGLPPQ
jgi:hypothetical protein